MKGIIVYKSKTGFTRRYAEWIGEALGFAVRPLGGIKAGELNGFSTVIYGGGIYAGRIGGLSRMKKLLPQGARLVLFATGATPAETPDFQRSLWEANLSESERGAIPHFYMQSGICYEKMGFADKALMRLFSMILNSKKDKTDIEAGSAQAIARSFDEARREYIVPLVAHVRGME